MKGNKVHQYDKYHHFGLDCAFVYYSCQLSVLPLNHYTTQRATRWRVISVRGVLGDVFHVLVAVARCVSIKERERQDEPVDDGKYNNSSI